MRAFSISPSRRFLLLALALLLAGFAVRLALHDYHGLEGDDGFSLALSRTPTDTLVAGLMRLELDIHPPLHFLALKGWTALAGESLLSLRLMNVLADLMTGALLARLAGRTFGRRAGLVAALLWVVAPLLIYSTWLIRMYTLAALFAALAAVCTVEWLTTRRRDWLVGLALAVLAGLYTHIVGVVVAGAVALALLAGGIAARDLRRTLAGWGALAGAGVLFLPFALPVLDVYRSGRTLGATINTSQFGDLSEIPDTLVRTLLLHRPEAPGLLVLALLVVFTMLALWRGEIIRHTDQSRLDTTRGKARHAPTRRTVRNRPVSQFSGNVRLSAWRRVLPLVVLAWVGILGMMLLGAADFYKPRYLTPFVVPALALLAGGVVALPGRWLRGAAVLAMVAAGVWGIRADLDRTTRDDWAAAAAFVAAHERPGDTVIVIPDWGAEAFRFHYRGAASVTGVFSGVNVGVDYGPTLAALSEGHDNVWLVRYQPEVSDPDGLADAWFVERAATAWTVFPPGMQVKYYMFVPQVEALPGDVRPLDARFADELALRGVTLPVTQGTATDTRLHPPSNWVHVTLYWEALQSPVLLTPRVRLTDTYGQVYGEAFEAANGPMARWPVGSWATAAIQEVPYTINVNPATPDGVYNIEVMALDASGQPVPTTGTDAGANWIIAGQFVVE
jgi:4-amino-4-deoxy-L-arabinose transferase-like glycosyltransferase